LRKNIYNSSFAELKSFFNDLDEKAFRAEQLWNWLYVKGIDELSRLNNISKNVINKINEQYYLSQFKLVKVCYLKMELENGCLS